jgi:hypothetical protein
MIRFMSPNRRIPTSTTSLIDGWIDPGGTRTWFLAEILNELREA